MDNDAKFNLLLGEMKNICNKIDERFEEFEEKFLNVNKKTDSLETCIKRLEDKITQLDYNNKKEHQKMFENINRIDSKIDKLGATNQEEHKKLFENIDRIDTRITTLKSNNTEDHRKISKQLDSINSSFIRYETDGTDKIKILFDSDVDRKNHQAIYGHEFKRLNELIARNSFRISNLEQHLNNNN